MRGVFFMSAGRYNILVTICVWILRVAMIAIALAIPLVFTVNNNLLNKMAGINVLEPKVYYCYHMVYSEIILGVLQCLFINFKNRVIFVEKNAIYLKQIGKLIILRVFIYIPFDFIFNQKIFISFEFRAWLIGFIMILFSKLMLHAFHISKEQEYTV